MRSWRSRGIPFDSRPIPTSPGVRHRSLQLFTRTRTRSHLPPFTVHQPEPIWCLTLLFVLLEIYSKILAWQLQLQANFNGAPRLSLLLLYKERQGGRRGRDEVARLRWQPPATQARTLGNRNSTVQ
jgi:hypothetical protein